MAKKKELFYLINADNEIVSKNTSQKDALKKAEEMTLNQVGEELTLILVKVIKKFSIKAEYKSLIKNKN